MSVRLRLSMLLLLFPLLPGLTACAPKPANAPALRLLGTGIEPASFDQARELIDRGKIAEAITVFRTLLHQDGPSLPVLNGLAIAHAELGRPDLAAELFAKALAMAPGDPATLNNIGYAALRRQDTVLARQYLEKAVAAGSDAPKIAGNLDVLDRLEALPQAAVRAAPFSNAALGPLFTVQRQTDARVRLSGLQTTEHDRPTPTSQRAEPGTGLIDFVLLFDPYPTPPGEPGLIDFDDLFDPWPTSPSPASAAVPSPAASPS